ncbi:unnamed protein product [Closterium sp. Naga37s-1]|nr:unnamed protein product [Closterium sp. Naga37s-1]
MRAPCPVDACALTRRCARPAFAVVPPAPCPRALCLISARAFPHRRAPPCPLVAAVPPRVADLPYPLASALPFFLAGAQPLLLPGARAPLRGAPSQTLAPHTHPIRPPHPPLFSPPAPSCLSSSPPASPLHLLQLAATSHPCSSVLVANCGPPCLSVKSPPFPQSAPSPSSSSPLSLQFPLHYLTPSSTSSLSSSAAAGS